jgi:chromosome segregation ATPase
MTPDNTNLITELEQRISELSVALELVTEDRDNLRDAGNSLMTELDLCRSTLTQAHSDISRLRVYLAQGAEL